MSENGKILSFHGVSKSFDGVTAVEDVSFALKKGTITALIGPNGAGKTTMFNLIGGFLRVDKGEIFLKDKKINRLSPFRISRLGIGRTFQNIRLFPQMSVVENVMTAVRYKGGESLFSAIVRRGLIRREEKEKADEDED